jgi:hypothetical protein
MASVSDVEQLYIVASVEPALRAVKEGLELDKVLLEKPQYPGLPVGPQ